MKRALIIIPCYNEEESLPKLAQQLTSIKIQDYVLHPLVVNDCSKDNTNKVALSLGFKVLDLPVNLGIGGAVQSGLHYAAIHNYDIAFQMDGDGQHPPSEIEKLIALYKNSQSDVIIGSRFLNKVGFQSSFSRRTGIRFFTFLIKLLCGIKITDPTSGYRLFNRKAIIKSCSYYPDEYPEPEAVVYFHKCNLKINECAVLMAERQGGQSSINSFSGIYYMLKVSLAIFFTFIRKFPNG